MPTQLQILTQKVSDLIDKINGWETNAKKISELPLQTTIDPTSIIHVQRGTESEKVSIQQIIDHNNLEKNLIVSYGTITRTGNDFLFSTGYIWIINGISYANSTSINRNITNATDGYYRIDIAVLDTNGNIVIEQGIENDEVASQPTTPANNLLLSVFNIYGDVIDSPIITPSEFVKRQYFGLVDCYEPIDGEFTAYQWLHAPISGDVIARLKRTVYSPDWILLKWTTIEENPRTWTASKFEGTTWSDWVLDGSIANEKDVILDTDYGVIIDESDNSKKKKTTWLKIWANYFRAKVLSEIATALVAIQIAIDGKESLSNKATDFSTVNHTKYPTVQAVKTYADNLVVGLIDDRGSYNASVNVFPTTGGSGPSGSVLKGDLWYVNTAGTLGGQSVGVGDSFRALVDSPGQTATNWDILEANIGYVPAKDSNVIHKTGDETKVGILTTSSTKSPITENGFTGIFGGGNEGTPGFVNSIMSKWRTNFYGSLFDFSIFRNDSADLVKAEMLFNEIMKFRFERNGNFTAAGTATASPATTNDHLITKGQVISVINELVDDIESNFTPLVVPTATISTQAVNLQQLNENLATFSVVNTTTVDLDLSYLNTSYPTARIGFEVLCPYIPVKPGIYKKMDNADGGVWHFIYSENIT